MNDLWKETKKLGVTKKKNQTHYHLLHHTSEINYFCLNVPVKAHTQHRDYADATQMCLVIISCKLLITRQEFAPVRKGYCIPSPFQTFNFQTLETLNPLPITPPWIWSSTGFAFKPKPANSLFRVLLLPPACPFTEVRSSAAEVRVWDTEAMHYHTASPPGLLLGKQSMAG